MKLWKIHARANSLRLRKCKSLHLRLEVRESLKLGFHLLCIFILKNNNERCCHIFPVLNNLLNNKYYDICRLNLHVELFVWVEIHQDSYFINMKIHIFVLFILTWKPLWHVAAHQTVVKLSLFNHLVKFIKNPVS